MARAAAGDVAYARLAVFGFHFADANFVFGDQVRAKSILICETLPIHRDRIVASRRLITHIKDLITGTQILAWIAMASQAPLHLQTFLLVHQRHLVHRPVAGIATDALGDVNAVIEIHEVGELIDARPLQRFARPVAGAHGLEQLGVRPDLRVAIHAGLRWRNSGEARCLDRGVAVAAIDPESGNVVLMAERNRLRLAHAGVGHERRSLDQVNNPA